MLHACVYATCTALRVLKVFFKALAVLLYIHVVTVAFQAIKFVPTTHTPGRWGRKDPRIWATGLEARVESRRDEETKRGIGAEQVKVKVHGDRKLVDRGGLRTQGTRDKGCGRTSIKRAEYR